MSSMQVAPELAARILQIDYQKLPSTAIANAKTAIIDTVGVILAGSGEQAPRLVARLPGMSDRGSSSLFGLGTRTNCLNAALVNGVSAHAMDFDDVNIAIGGHPSAVIFPALYAAAEMAQASGKQLLAAFVAGFETETRLARAVNFHHYEKGWHSTTTLGVFGAAAACAHLLQLPQERVATALAMATTLASGVKANFGTMTKPLGVGHCSRSGLFAALLARDGFTANPLAFEHKQGFLNLFNGAGHYDVEKIADGWADPLDIVRPGTGIKLYPCCGSAHASIDAMISLREKYQPAAADVAKIKARIHSRRLIHINRPDPASDLDAKFSVHYCLARALMEGRVVVDHFENSAFRDPAVQSLMKKVEVDGYVNPPPDIGDHYAVDVTVYTAAGQEYHVRTERPCGRIPEDPTPPNRLHSKFESCAGRALPDAQVRDLYAALEKLEAVNRITDLAELLAAPATHRGAAATSA